MRVVCYFPLFNFGAIKAHVVPHLANRGENFSRRIILSEIYNLMKIIEKGAETMPMRLMRKDREGIKRI